MNIGVLVSGRGSNLQAIIDAVESGYIKAKISVVISSRKDAPALQRAKEHGIEAIFIDPQDFWKDKEHREEKRVEYDKKIIAELEKRNVDLVLLAGYMLMLSPYFVNKYKNRIMNIHPALLPSFPGVNAQKQALEYGVKYTGATVHFVDAEMDHGPIILQDVVPVLDDDTVETLSNRILEKEHKIYVEAVKLFTEGKLKVEGRRVKILK
ncbi:MAG: phosphoribosylglycinamide formyltransferase [Candidatus Freyarchaeota archaeon]|nr:phosphoribosylglycinamide formyltransferase [Candidatus Jordarchaeia archaeon]MBS7267440.1 phosphoribosylglycinamide formyltransferase [Candidatus Jordarchaeia archaeon]MBS7280370.1 phosphoribosylglycinamide formyltransferase [Candidatus Jordarchaeia archaeon]